MKSNIIHIPAARFDTSDAARVTAHIAAFSTERRDQKDVFWLKKVAEVLNILESSGIDVPNEALAPLEPFYDQIETQFSFFPQYYRFLLSIAQDLETLGMPGEAGARIAHAVHKGNLAGAELSDLQRAEAWRLVRRRCAVVADQNLMDRLRRFAGSPQVFALPNKKAAYELTHITFYLSEYGRKDPQLSEPALTSLHFVGLLAFLEQNSDLLAEVCVALDFAGQTPPRQWTDWIGSALERVQTEAGFHAGAGDDYHDYLVCNWAVMRAGARPFNRRLPEGAVSFRRAAVADAPLRDMSRCLYQLADMRRPGWSKMRKPVRAALSEEGRRILDAAEASSEVFDIFFEGFARATPLRAAG